MIVWLESKLNQKYLMNKNAFFIPFTETPSTETPRRNMRPGTETPPCVQTDTCENITLNQTSCAGGNNIKLNQ